MGRRQCPHCGASVSDSYSDCPRCREHMPVATVSRAYRPTAGGDKIRRGMLYMLLAAVCYYFAAGYSGLELPFSTSNIAIATEYLLPFLFLAGLGLVVYGLILRARG